MLRVKMSGQLSLEIKANSEKPVLGTKLTFWINVTASSISSDRSFFLLGEKCF